MNPDPGTSGSYSRSPGRSLQKFYFCCPGESPRACRRPPGARSFQPTARAADTCVSLAPGSTRSNAGESKARFTETSTRQSGDARLVAFSSRGDFARNLSSGNFESLLCKTRVLVGAVPAELRVIETTFRKGNRLCFRCISLGFELDASSCTLSVWPGPNRRPGTGPASSGRLMDVGRSRVFIPVQPELYLSPSFMFTDSTTRGAPMVMAL